MVNRKSVGQGVVHVQNGFAGIGYSGTMPFRDGQEVFVVRKDDWESILHEIALASEHSPEEPPIEMPSKLAKIFPLALKPVIDGVARTYFLDANVYRPNNHMLFVRYISMEEGMRILQRSSSNRLSQNR